MDELYISIFQTFVRVDFKNYATDGSFITLLSAQRDLNDDYWHSITFTGAQDAISLDVDGKTVLQSMANFTGQLMMAQDRVVEIGGLSATPTDAIPVSESYRGCMRDFALNDE